MTKNIPDADAAVEEDEFWKDEKKWKILRLIYIVSIFLL